MKYIFTNHSIYKINCLTKLFNKSLYIAIVLFTSILFGQTATPPAAGDGSSGNPYQIATLENLYWLSQQQSNSDINGPYWSRNYIQTADIDASASSSWDGGSGWTPIGNNTSNFSGSYDGQKHTINGLYISRSGMDNQGLFGYTSGTTITNVIVTNVNITGNSYIGALVGNIINSTAASDCYSTGNVSITHFCCRGFIAKLQTLSPCMRDSWLCFTSYTGISHKEINNSKLKEI